MIRVSGGAWSLLAGAFAILLLAATESAAQCSAPYLVEQSFPIGGPEETRWRICWRAQSKNGLVITAAFFRKSPQSPFIRVFWDARISEIFVPFSAVLRCDRFQLQPRDAQRRPLPQSGRRDPPRQSCQGLPRAW